MPVSNLARVTKKRRHGGQSEAPTPRTKNPPMYVFLTSSYKCSSGLSELSTPLKKVRDRPMSPASEIHPKSYKWTVLVQVMERRKTRKSRVGDYFRNYIVTDMQGTIVPMVAFGNDVFKFEDTLLPYNRYKVSNAIVKYTQELYKVFPYPCTWTIHKTIQIEPYPDTIPHPLPCAFSFDKFSDFHLYADQPREICVKAMVVHAFPLRHSSSTISYRDYIVINEEMIPVNLRVWDDLLNDSDVNVYAKYKHPTMIVAYGIRVTTHSWISLGTKEYVYFMQDPPLNETCPLKDWYVAHSKEVQEMVENYAWRDTSLLFHPPRQGEIMSLGHALATIETVKTVWTEGRLNLFPGQRKLWMQVCEKCYSEVDSEGDLNVWCMTCKELTDTLIRGSLIVSLTNGGRTIQATIKSPDVEKLLPFTPTEIMEAAMQGEPITDKVEEELREKHVVCFLKYYDHKTMGMTIRRYPILKVYTEADVHAYHANQTQAPGTQNSTTLAIQNSQTQTATSSGTALVTTEKQFFSPTTKSVLEELMQAPSLDDIRSECSSGVKRMLTFEESPAKAMPTGDSENPADYSPARTPKTEDEMPSPSSAQLTPNKKSKGKDHEQ